MSMPRNFVLRFRKNHELNHYIFIMNVIINIVSEKNTGLFPYYVKHESNFYRCILFNRHIWKKNI